MSDQWQDRLRNRMDLHEEIAPEGLWEGIEERIEIVTPILKKINGSKRNLVIWSLGSVAVAAVVLIMVVLLPFNTDTPLIPIGDNVLSELNKSSDAEIDNSYIEVMVADNNSNSKIKQPILKHQIDDSELIKSRATNHKDTENVFFNENKSEHGESSEKQTLDIIDDSDENESLDVEEKILSNNDNHSAMSMKKIKQRDNKWQTNLVMSNISTGYIERFVGYGTLAMKETVEDQYTFLNRYEDKIADSEIEHNLPITVGITFKYNINQIWGISSGLTYSLLTSKLRSESLNYYYDDRQILHYIGIPINVDYKLWKNNNLSTYISTGGLVERNIAGKLKSDYYIDNKLQLSTNESISSKQLQWSVNSAIGVEYNISDNIGLYAEPGFAYYFKNNSELETIYKDRPLSFNLKLGLRISFNN